MATDLLLERFDAPMSAPQSLVLAHDIRLTENGSVSSFDLTVTLDDGSTPPCNT